MAQCILMVRSTHAAAPCAGLSVSEDCAHRKRSNMPAEWRNKTSENNNRDMASYLHTRILPYTRYRASVSIIPIVFALKEIPLTMSCAERKMASKEKEKEQCPSPTAAWITYSIHNSLAKLRVVEFSIK